MNPSAFSLPEMLMLEADPEILTFCTAAPHIPLWLLLRLYFLRLIISDHIYKETPLIQTQGSAVPVRKILKVLSSVDMWTSARSTPQSSRILIRATGTGLQQQDGKYFNRLSDYFASAQASDTLVLEDFFNWQWPIPRENQHVLYNTPWRMIDKVKARFKLSSRDRETVATLITWLRRRSQSILNWDMNEPQLRWFTSQALHAVAGAPLWYERYHTLLKNRKIRLLIAEEASYGGWLACLVKAAKDLGIPTAEYQHGMVSAGHDAYNFSPSLLAEKSMTQFLPDCFLTYGDWWGTQINLPSRQVVIGNPHRSAVLGPKNQHHPEKTDILILGDGRETGLHLQLANQIAQSASSHLQVVFRPHPHERHKFLPGGEFVDASPCKIDTRADMYDSLKRADSVISEMSTGLFEAAGLAPRIFVWETSKSKFVLPNHPFIGFHTTEQLATHLQAAIPEQDASVLGESIWASNWEKRYADFIHSID